MITMGILFKIVCLSSKFYQNIRENKILVKVAKGIAKMQWIIYLHDIFQHKVGIQLKIITGKKFNELSWVPSIKYYEAIKMNMVETV
jgi:hypothetical protein